MQSHRHIIEEEPSHEIYANLVGLKRNHLFHNYTHGSFSNTNNSPTNKVQVERRSSAHIHSLSPEHESKSNHISNACREDVSIPRIVVDINEDEHVSKNPLNTKTLSLYRKRLAESSSKVSLSQLSLDRSNKGFRILERMGWKESRGGLGRKRQGALSPLKTTWKRDKCGLGSGPRFTPKVTHHVRGPKEVKNKCPIQKTSVIDTQLNEQAKNKRARMMITSDLPDELLAFCL